MLKNLLYKLYRPFRKEFEAQKILAAKSLVHAMAQRGPLAALEEAEFKVFSQAGEDGILQYLLQQASGPIPRTFVEFGVENYTEANTRFLLMNNNWKGLILDGSAEHMDFVHRDYYFWMHDLTARTAFITTDNINKLLAGAGFQGDLGLLSIDIDGNDYWVWEAIQVARPVIVSIEYNSLFGAEREITVPYRADFQRSKAHYSNLYFGASLSALVFLGEQKGYALVGCNSAGTNAFFVREDRLGGLQKVSRKDGYRPSPIRQSRDQEGRLNFFDVEAQRKEIAGLPVVNVRSGAMEQL